MAAPALQYAPVMTPERAPVLTEKLANILRPVCGSYVERFRPVERYENVGDISNCHVSVLVESGRTLWISDIDATATSCNGSDISDETRSFYASIKESGGSLIFWTNTTGKTEDELIRLEWIAEELGAEYVTFKDAPDMTKPSPAKIHAILEERNRDRDPDDYLTMANVVLVGDKLTADIVAGYYASEEVHTIWVNWKTAAGVDHIRFDEGSILRRALRWANAVGPEVKGDYFVRRPLENLLWLIMDKKTRMDIDPSSSKVKVDPTPVSYGRTKQPQRLPSHIPSFLKEHSRIANVGSGPVVEVSDEKFDTLQPPFTETFHELVRDLQDSRIMKYIDEIGAQHGKEIADWLTLSRIIGAPIVFGLIVSGQPALARKAYWLFATTDVVDGFFAGIWKRHNQAKSESDTVVSIPDNVIQLRTGYVPENISHSQTKREQAAELMAMLQGAIVRDEENGSINGRKTAVNLKQLFNEWMDEPGWGERWDPKSDKDLSNAALLGIAMRNPKAALLLSASIYARDWSREKIQKPMYEEDEYTSNDLRATPSSKASSFVLNNAISLCLSPTASKLRIASSLAAASADKWYSMLTSPRIWKRRKEFRETAVQMRKELELRHAA